jgi:hypothetical protein
LTAKEVVERLRQAGVPRSIRRVTEYCQRGDLDTFRDPDERRWYVTPASVNELIRHFQELQSRYAATVDIRAVPSHAAVCGMQPPATAGDCRLRSPTAVSNPPAHPVDLPSAAADKIKHLEDELTGLRISNQAKDIVIGQLKEERASFIKQLQQRAFTIGRLKTQLLRLQAPKPPEDPLSRTTREIRPATPQTQPVDGPSPLSPQSSAEIRNQNTEERV